MNRRTRNRILFALLVGLLIVFTELIARLYIVMAYPKGSAPAAAQAEIVKLHMSLTPDGYWVQSDFAGTFYNIQNNQRRTVGQPARFVRSVWLFGNSGTFDPYVDDAHTMASQLQALLNASGYAWRVVNLGASGQFSSGDLARLKDTPVRAGDIIVFIDGSMDMTTHDSCSDRLATYYMACAWYWSVHPSAPDVARFARNIASARAYTHAAGAQFIQFVQPYIATHYLDVLPGPHIYLPPSDFVDSSHMNAQGDAVVARVLYDSVAAF